MTTSARVYTECSQYIQTLPCSKRMCTGISQFQAVLHFLERHLKHNLDHLRPEDGKKIASGGSCARPVNVLIVPSPGGEQWAKKVDFGFFWIFFRSAHVGMILTQF